MNDIELVLSIGYISFLPVMVKSFLNEVELSDVFGLVDGGLLSHPEGVDLVLLHDVGDCIVEEHQLSDHVGYVDVQTGLLGTVDELLGFLPVDVTADSVEPPLDDRQQVVPGVEGLGVDLLIVVVDEQLPGDADLEGLFSVEAHDEEEGDHGSHQPAHVGEVVVDLVELPGVGGALG